MLSRARHGAQAARHHGRWAEDMPTKPKREPKPGDTLLGLLVLAGIVWLIVHAIRTTDFSPPTHAAPVATPVACVINGFGNKLCGDDAIAYCDLRDRTLRLTGDSLDACESVGWSR